MGAEEVSQKALISFNGASDIYRISQMEGGLEAMEAFVKLYPSSTGETLAEGKATKNELQEERVVNRILADYDFVKVTELRDRGVFYKSSKLNVYKRMTDLDRDHIVQDTFAKYYKRKPNAEKTKKIGETLMSWVDNERGRINNDIIMIKENLFWDYKAQKFINKPAEGVECFRRLFDHKDTDEIKIDPKDIDEVTIRLVANQVYKHLNENGGKINVETIENDCPTLSTKKQPLNAFWLWANEDEDTMNDILMALSCNFMKVKPKGAFILIGKTRNGKSSFIMLLHTQFGHNNTAEVALADLNDPHLNMDLLGALINAPDEEEEGRGSDILRAQGRFKKLATHKALSLQVYYSQTPQDVATDFMSYHAMNDNPEWKGGGADACMKRSLIIMFEHDFSKEDNNGKEFEKETYTPEFFSALLGIEFAFSKYYSGKEFKFSDKQKRRKQLVAEEVDNSTVYLDSFWHYFPGGYANAAIVFEDYKLWCEVRGLTWCSFKDFNKKLKLRGGYASRLTVDEEGNRIHIIRLDKDGNVFHRDFKVEQLGGRTIEYMLTSEEGFGTKHPRRAQSVIDQLDIRREDGFSE